MPSSRVFFVGTSAEVEHHASPLMGRLSVEIIGTEAVVDQTKAGDVAIFFSEHFDRFRESVVRLKKKNVATIYMVDGILEWRNAWENDPDEVACPFAMRPVLSHKVACIGANQAHVLASWGNAAKTEIVGVPRLDAYASGGETGECETGNDLPNDGDPRTAKTGIPVEASTQCGRPIRVLVMTAKTPAFTDDQWAKVKQSIADCKRYFDQHADSVDVVWRLTGGLDQFVDVENSVTDLTGRQLQEQLHWADAVISTPSTAVVEAMVAGKPTALLNYFECPCYLNAAWQITHASQLPKVMAQLRQPPVRHLHFQQFQLNQMLYQETSAIDRMVLLVRAMQDSAALQLEAGVKELQFETNLLPRPVSTMAEFSWQHMFPDAEAFANGDRIQTQAQLAHARRHINELDRRIEQLQFELGHAHQIFKQIHRHPIAGPIVRIRERLLKWFGQTRIKAAENAKTEHQNSEQRGKTRSPISPESQFPTRS